MQVLVMGKRMGFQSQWRGSSIDWLVQHHQPLSPSRQKELAKQYVEGGRTDGGIAQQLVMANLRYLAKRAHRFRRTGVLLPISSKKGRSGFMMRCENLTRHMRLGLLPTQLPGYGSRCNGSSRQIPGLSAEEILRLMRSMITDLPSSSIFLAMMAKRLKRMRASLGPRWIN